MSKHGLHYARATLVNLWIRLCFKSLITGRFLKYVFLCTNALHIIRYVFIQLLISYLFINQGFLVN